MGLKGFDISVQFEYNIGGKGYTANAYHKDILNAWSETNRTSDIPRFQYATTVEDRYANNTSDRFLRSATSLTLQNVNIGYSFPKSVLRKARIEKLRLYVSGDNLYYWSTRKGFDPRGSFWGSTTLDNALARTWTLGLEIGF